LAAVSQQQRELFSSCGQKAARCLGFLPIAIAGSGSVSRGLAERNGDGVCSGDASGPFRTARLREALDWHDRNLGPVR
jgi:hypothetical protein